MKLPLEPGLLLQKAQCDAITDLIAPAMFIASVHGALKQKNLSIKVMTVPIY